MGAWVCVGPTRKRGSGGRVGGGKMKGKKNRMGGLCGRNFRTRRTWKRPIFEMLDSRCVRSAAHGKCFFLCRLKRESPQPDTGLWGAGLG